jgi:hypothetical protein
MLITIITTSLWRYIQAHDRVLRVVTFTTAGSLGHYIHGHDQTLCDVIMTAEIDHLGSYGDQII